MSALLTTRDVMALARMTKESVLNHVHRGLLVPTGEMPSKMHGHRFARDEVKRWHKLVFPDMYKPDALDFVSIKQAAKLTGLAVITLRGKVEDGSLPVAHRIGRSPRFAQAALAPFKRT